jgi:hypothetical protein
MIIVAAPADGRKTRTVIHADSGIAVADLKMNSRNAVLARAIEELVEQQRPNAAALFVGKNRNQQ